jgi:hypothetical protein
MSEWGQVLQYHKDKDTELLGLLEFVGLLGSTSVRGWRFKVRGRENLMCCCAMGYLSSLGSSWFEVGGALRIRFALGLRQDIISAAVKKKHSAESIGHSVKKMLEV